MNKNEREILLELCKFRNPDCEKLEKLIRNGAATPNVLGHLFYNRMAAAAYGVLKETGLTDRTNREFRNSLKNAYTQNKYKNEGYFNCLTLLNALLSECKGKYALLKGAYLCGWYPEGYRTSNDVDILTEAKNISQITKKLSAAGFKQGYIRNGVFTPATRQEIVTSKMMRGETVPYIKEVNLPFMKYLEVDINYSLSYKNENNDIVKTLISNAKETEAGNLKVVTLDKYDFMLHLCEHLYKEATTYPWVKMKRDMTLYKFCDIYALLSDYKEEDFMWLQNRVLRLNLKESCYYAVYITRTLFSMKNNYLDSFLAKIMPESREVLNIVISPEDNRIYQYREENLEKRFFTSDRTKILMEVTKDAKA